MKKRTRIRYPDVGTIVEVPLTSGRRCYARILNSPLMMFYAVQSEQPLSIEQVLKSPVAFKIWVMRSAVTSGRWHIVGHAPLEKEFENSPWFFKQDLETKALSLYLGGIERPATKEACMGLEPAAVWSAEHVERRLEDHFAGRPNKSVQALAIQ